MLLARDPEVSDETIEPVRRQLDGLKALWGVTRAHPVPSQRDFEAIGHSLFALLIAWFGGMLGRYMHATRERKP